MISKLGYELFLPAVAAAVAGKEKSEDQLTDSELKAVVKVTFRDSVVNFMQDSLLYRVSSPIDLYQGVKRYDVIPPKGFLVEDVIGFESNKTKVPKLKHNTKSIDLMCCPIKDTDAAFYVIMALVPKRSANCTFEIDFLEKYYEAILANMFMRLSAMQSRVWKSLGQTLRYEREYFTELTQAKRRELNGGDVLKIKTTRLSNAPTTC